MGKMAVYSETVHVAVVRDGVTQSVMFCEVQDGDMLVDYPDAIVDGDAHFSGDSSYDGWIFYDTRGNDYYPEDFAHG